MNSLEALEQLRDKAQLLALFMGKDAGDHLVNVDTLYNTIKQDLERLEVLEKENKDLKDFQVLTKQGLWNLQQENQILNQSVKDTYDTGQEIIYELTEENEKLKNEKEKIKQWVANKIKYLDKGVFLMSGERVKGAIEILNELLKEVLK